MGGERALPVYGTGCEVVWTISCDVLDKVFNFLHGMLGDFSVMGSVGSVWAVRCDGNIKYHTLVSS